jgi:hypothetical protein
MGVPPLVPARKIPHFRVLVKLSLMVALKRPVTVKADSWRMNAASVRCYGPNRIIIDEAARVPDDLYRAVRPMLAVRHGRLVVLTTFPKGTL